MTAPPPTPVDKAASKLQRLARVASARRQRAELEVRLPRNDKLLAPFVTASPQVVDFFASQLCGPDDVVIDLGCGDGRVLRACLERGHALAVYGVDIQPAPLQRARDALQPWADRCNLLQADFFDDAVRALLGQCTICFLFLLPDTLAMLAPLLKRELKPGARVVCSVFKFPDDAWDADSCIEAPAPAVAVEARRLWTYTVRGTKMLS